MTRTRLVLVPLLMIVVGVLVWVANDRRSLKRPPNIVLISIDTCRADRLGCYGRRGVATRHIDALAKEGILFSNVISPVPLTLPAHSSMLTGTIPPYHGVHDNLHYKLGESSVTLAELLKAQGYQTAAAVGAFVLDRRFGLSQGFDTYDDEMDDELTFTGGHAERRGGETSRFANEWLETHGSKPFFLFLHYFDPHHPYRPPAQFVAIFADDLYVGEISYTDACIGQVIQTLKRLDLYDSTMIIVTGDHGEGLGEHGEKMHGYFIYHSTTKVPLIIKLPGKREPKRIHEKVGLVDIMPTVLAQAGLPVPNEVQGMDLSPFMSGETVRTTERRLYSGTLVPTKYGCTPLLAIETDDWKYIQTAEPELYDLIRDPGEKNNLYDEQPQHARRLQAGLREILERHLRTGRDENTALSDTVSLERLRQLGYTGGAVTESFEFDTTGEDPKGFLDIFTKIEGANFYISSKEYEKARTLCEEILTERRDVGYVHILLGKVAFYKGNIEETVTHYSEAVRLKPDAPDWQYDLGLFLAEVGRLGDAIDRYDKALQLLRSLDEQQESIDSALTDRRQAHPLLPQIHFNRGIALFKLGNVEESIQEYQDSLRDDPENPNVHYRLGAALMKLGRIEDAKGAFGEALRLNPDHREAGRALHNATDERGETPAP